LIVKSRRFGYVRSVTVLEVIQRSTDFLTKKGVESARLNAELLLAHVLKVPRLKLYLDFQRVLSDAELSASRELIQRRAGREPLQQIVGSAGFCGLEIMVTPSVLIPRPETELLAERGWVFINELRRPATVLDFATGSGCIALAIAANSQNAVLHASDISISALEVARSNANRLQLAPRINFHQSDGLQQLPEGLKFDLIISNPPYIPAAEIESLAPEVRRFDPRLALDGGIDGLDFYRTLANEGGAPLNTGGKIMLEFGDGQGSALMALFADHGWIGTETLKDYSGRERIFIAERPRD